MTKTTVTPFVNSTATQVELSDGDNKKVYWKKEITPSGKRSYKGQTLDFSVINPAIVKAFDEKVLDAVPFVLALTDNAHPEPGQEADRLEGDLHKFELSEDGRTFGYFDFSESPDMEAKIKKSGGKFGVSARIDVNYTREDTGKTYDYVLSHVCGTTRPHIKGMKPWETVTLSEEAKKNLTVDLSTEVIDAETSGEVVELPEGVSKSDFDAVLAFIADQKKAEEAIAKLTGDDDKDKGAATLSETDRKAIELSEQRASQALKLAEEARKEAAAERWNAQKSLLIRDGVPPAIVALAEPVLSSPKKATIKLSDTDEVDATKVVADILEACKGTITFSESGSQTHRESGNGDLDKEFAEWAGEWGFDLPAGQSE